MFRTYEDFNKLSSHEMSISIKKSTRMIGFTSIFMALFGGFYVYAGIYYENGFIPIIVLGGAGALLYLICAIMEFALSYAWDCHKPDDSYDSLLMNAMLNVIDTNSRKYTRDLSFVGNACIICAMLLAIAVNQ